METLKLFFIVFGSLGALSALLGVTLIFVRQKSFDRGTLLSGGIGLFYGILTALSAWLSLEPLPHWWIWLISPMGIMIIMLSQLLSIWAKSHMGKVFSTRLTPLEQAHLIQTGPFQICRHPMMLSYLMLWAGTMLALGSLIHLVSLPIAAIFILRRVALEESYLSQVYGEEFADYKNKVSMIVPCLDPTSEEALEIEQAVAKLAGLSE